MPVITIDIGSIPVDQKSELIRTMTENASRITHIPSDFFTVVIHEQSDDNIGIGGKTIRETKEIHAKKRI